MALTFEAQLQLLGQFGGMVQERIVTHELKDGQMKYEWTTEKLAALPTDRLESLKQNALHAGDHKLAETCEALQISRKPEPKAKAAPKKRTVAAVD